MTDQQYLEKVLEGQDLSEDSIEMKELRKHRQNVEEVFQIPTVQPDRTRALAPLQAVVQAEGLRKIFAVPFPLPRFRSCDLERMFAVVLAGLPAVTVSRKNAVRIQHRRPYLLAACWWESKLAAWQVVLTAGGHSATNDRHRVGSVSPWAATWRAALLPGPVRSWRTLPGSPSRIAADSKRPPLPRRD